MMSRCYRKGNNRYARYGGRGIKVCKRWHNFNNFYNDTQNGFKPELQLDRIDNDGDYCKRNCQWVTPREQSLNRHTNVNLTFNNKTQPMIEWARELGMKKQTLWSRINDYGWTVEAALSCRAPVKKRVECDNCRKIFTSNIGLGIHRRKIHGIKSGKAR